jgi:hypothetical protein
MKKSINSLVFGSAIFLLSAGPSFGQQTDVKSLPEVTVTSSAATMSSMVWANFQKDFKGATNVTWYKIDKDFLIKFIMGEISQRALYNSKGHQIYHISYVGEKFTPDDVKDLLKSAFGTYLIIGSTKVEEAGRTIYVVNLQNKKNVALARVEDGEAEMVALYKRGDL